MATGGIIHLNVQRGMLVVQIDSGDCTVFELMGGYDVKVGHRVNGDLDSSLCETLQNLSTGESISVYVQGQGCSPEHGRRLIWQ